MANFLNPYLRQTRGYRAYLPVTAYTADRPVLVNGFDINTGVYPVLNYQPTNAEYPYVYVPIAEFNRVGAKVEWDPVNMVINVKSDYEQLKAQIEQLKAENEQLKNTYGLAKEVGNTSGNLLNGGFAASAGDWIYFVVADNGNKIYRMRQNGESKEKLTDAGGGSINILNGWVYFIANSKICKMKLDGSELTCFDLPHMVSKIVVVDEWIYYVTTWEQQRIHKIKIDGTNQQLVSDDTGVENMYVYDGWIYYLAKSNNNKIYRMKTDGTMKVKLFDTQAMLMNVVGKYIYFVEVEPGKQGGRIIRIQNDGTDFNAYETGIGIFYLNVVDEDTFFIADRSKIYKYQPGTPTPMKDLTPVFDFSGYINVVDDWLFYLVFSNGYKLYQQKTDGTQGNFAVAR